MTQEWLTISLGGGIYTFLQRLLESWWLALVFADDSLSCYIFMSFLSLDISCSFIAAVRRACIAHLG